MDTVTTRLPPETEVVFDTARIAKAIDTLAEKHAGKDDLLRSAIAQLLKGELAEAREAAQAQLLKDRHGRRCAERCGAPRTTIKSASHASRHDCTGCG